MSEKFERVIPAIRQGARSLKEGVGGEILIVVVVEVRDDARELLHANGGSAQTPSGAKLPIPQSRMLHLPRAPRDSRSLDRFNSLPLLCSSVTTLDELLSEEGR